jgi:hypothetical protein
MMLLLKSSLNLKLLLLTFNLFIILKVTLQLRERKKNTRITSDILVILE